MTFNANIPQPGDFISASQSEIQTNFSQSNTAFGIDHTAFDVVSNQGKHKQVTLITPVAAVGAGAESVIHSVNGVASSVSFNGVPLPFFANSVGDLPMIPDILKGAGNDWSCKIGKLIINFGFNVTSAGASPTRAITFNEAYTSSSTLLNVMCNAYLVGLGSVNIAVGVLNPISTGFTATSPANGSLNFYYLAIGY